jgi:acyl-CoA reductase-like NAD-dependent aldehyde dehydrogenase
MPWIKTAIVTVKLARSTWSRLPPEQRAKLLEGAKTTVRTHGPLVARHVGRTIEKARKGLK